MAKFPTVPFHEDGIPYTWHIPSGQVKFKLTGKPATDHKCITLDQARRRVRKR